MKTYDIVVFGATGYTGQYVVEYVAKAAREDLSLKWAVAGRNSTKLAKVMQQAESNTGYVDLASSTDVILCDVKDQASLEAMAAQAKLVLNCVGPYRFSGEQVVQACLAGGAHHIDISGEPQFLEKIQLKYHKEAEAKGVYVIGACGFDSIPSDMGRALVHKEMEGPVNTVSMFLQAGSDGPAKGPGINFGTYQSAVHGVANFKELRSIRKQLYPNRLPKFSPKVGKRGFISKSEEVGSWCLLFPGSDHSVMMRSERARFDSGERPAQVFAYVALTSFIWAVLGAIAFMLFGALCNFKFGRWLLETFPYVFSLGNVSKAGPSKEVIKQSWFKMTLVGKGWSGREDTAKDTDLKEKPNRTVKVVVQGKNVGYGATCECMVQSAIVTLKQTEKLPSTGGVWTPGFAFSKTDLIERLNARQVTFDTTVLSEM